MLSSILDLTKTSIAKYAIFSIIGICALPVAYYVVRSHFEKSFALKSAISYQKKSKALHGFSNKISQEYFSKRKEIYQKKILCSQKECTVEEIKNAFN